MGVRVGQCVHVTSTGYPEKTTQNTSHWLTSPAPSYNIHIHYYTGRFTSKRHRINKSYIYLRMKTKNGTTLYFTILTQCLPAPFALFPLARDPLCHDDCIHPLTLERLVCLCLQAERNPIIFISTRVCTRHVSFSSLNYCDFYN